MNNATTMQRCNPRARTPRLVVPGNICEMRDDLFDKLDDLSVMLVRDRDNYPECRRGSLLLLGDTGFVDNGFYVVCCGSVPVVRMVQQIWGANFSLHATAAPWNEHDQEVTRRELDELKPRRVVAVLQPHAPGFAQLVRERFAADGGRHG